jgi:hypothetical protein
MRDVNLTKAAAWFSQLTAAAGKDGGAAPASSQLARFQAIDG